jgi:hypothetical protein
MAKGADGDVERLGAPKLSTQPAQLGPTQLDLDRQAGPNGDLDRYPAPRSAVQLDDDVGARSVLPERRDSRHR